MSVNGGDKKVEEKLLEFTCKVLDLISAIIAFTLVIELTFVYEYGRIVKIILSPFLTWSVVPLILDIISPILSLVGEKSSPPPRDERPWYKKPCILFLIATVSLVLGILIHIGILPPLPPIVVREACFWIAFLCEIYGYYLIKERRLVVTGV